MIRLLLAGDDIDVNAKDQFGFSPLMKATQYGQLEIARLLLEREDINLNTKDAIGRTPWTMAKKYCLEEIIQLLLEAGARRGIQLEELVTPDTTVTDEDPAWCVLLETRQLRMAWD
jgi:ankyrin repeat protein